MSKEIQNLKFLLVPLSFFCVLTVFFVLAFFTNQKKYFLISAGLLVMFLSSYKVCFDAITFKNGYNALQAYDFYKKCHNNGVENIPNKINDTDMETLNSIAKTYDFATSFDKKKLKELYNNGYNVAKYLQKFKIKS